MSGLYAYGVMRAADAAGLPPIAGIGGAPLSALPVGGLALLVADAPEAEIRRARRNLTAHIRALETATPFGPVLPMRFGVVSADADAIAAAVVPRAAELAGLLDRHEGLAEYGVRVSFPREAALAALGAERPDFARRRAALAGTSGPDAHRMLLDLGQAVAEALDRRRQAAQKALLAVLAPLTRAHVLGAAEDDAQVLRAEFLLPQAEEAAFAATLDAAAAACGFAPGAPAAIRLVGPAPIYNFISLSLDAAAAAAA